MEGKTYYRIKDIAEFTGESQSTLRFWEKEFNVLAPKRGGKGRRLYTAGDLETIKKIQFLLRDKGMHISAAKEQLKSNLKNISTKAEALNTLEKLREELVMLHKSLSKISRHETD